MTMQRRHFELIAEVVSGLPGEGQTFAYGLNTREAVALRFAAELEKTNPQFNRDRFLKACGVQED